MPCGCQGNKAVVSGPTLPSIAGEASSGARYTVLAPDGSTETFDRYIDAAVHRRQVNGTLTTHT